MKEALTLFSIASRKFQEISKFISYLQAHTTQKIIIKVEIQQKQNNFCSLFVTLF
jgi:hypothetical protein